MRLQWIRVPAALLAAAVAGAAATAQAPYGAPSLMPAPQGGPQMTGFPAFPTRPSAPAAFMPTQSSAPLAAAGTNGEMSAALDGAGSYGNGCGCQGGCGDCGGNWYASVAGLVLTRDRPNNFALTNDGATPANTVIATRDLEQGWVGGWEVTIGRRIGCDCALEATYWGADLWEDSQMQIATAQASGTLGTNLDFGTMAIGGTLVNDLFATAAGAHLLTRCSEVHNIELNLVHDFCSSGCDPCSRCWAASGLLGVRFLGINDCLLYAASDDDTVFVFDGNEVYYQNRTENNLVGVQLGGRFDYFPTRARCVSLWVAPRVGVYGNHIRHRQRVYNINGEAFNIQASKNDVAVIGQIDVGLDYQISTNWKAFAGYRVVGVAGVAQPEDQYQTVVSDFNGIVDVDSSGSLIYHGGFAGLEYRW